MAKERFEPTTYWLGNKKDSSTSRVRTQDLQPDSATIIEVTKCINGVEIKWSFGRLVKKRITDYDFPPPFMSPEATYYPDVPEVGRTVVEFVKVLRSNVDLFWGKICNVTELTSLNYRHWKTKARNKHGTVCST